MTEARNPADYFSSIHVTAGPSVPPSPQASSGPTQDPRVLEILETLAEQNRELILLARRQLELGQRMEERYEKQMIAQRDEFARWLDDEPGLLPRSKQATEAIRNLLGRLIADLVEYVGENDESLHESEFVRAEMVDKYGQLLNHISTMYGMLKRLSTADEGMPPRTS